MPRRSGFSAPDCHLNDFGVPFLPSGTRHCFIRYRHGDRYTWQTVGNAATVSINHSRVDAHALFAATGERGDKIAPALVDPPFELVAVEMLRRYACHCKPT